MRQDELADWLWSLLWLVSDLLPGTAQCAIGSGLVGAVGAARHIATGDVDRNVRVHRVLVGVGTRERRLQRERVLAGQLRLPGPTTADEAGRTRDWLWLLLWLVSDLLPAPLAAPLSAVWLALLAPPVTSPPAMLTGTLALTVFWLAFAFESASWPVADFWSDNCTWPAPPQPILQSEPADWL